MGYGSYKASDWAKLRSSKGINNSSSISDIFADEFKDKYNPKFIDMRESRDSDDSPESTPIIIGFDVTGSMGYLAEEIAKNSLNKTITEIYDKQPVTNPHVMCAAFTSPSMREGCLQVTQFEADIRVVEQLFDLKVNFGGNTYSYDNLVWYFASRHTDIDCFKKRGKKGLIFCIGDEICGYQNGDYMTAREIESVFGDKDIKEHVKLQDSYEKVCEKYEVFHIVTDMGYRFEKSLASWMELMPGRVASIKQDDIDHLSELIISLMQVLQGRDVDVIVNQWPEEIRPIINEGLKYIYA